MKSNVQNSGIEFLGYQFCWDILRNKEFGFTREQSFFSHTKDGKTDRKFFLKKSENLCAIVFPNSSKVLFLETREEKKIGISWNSQNLRLLPVLFLFLFLWLLKGTSKIILIFFLLF